MRLYSLKPKQTNKSVNNNLKNKGYNSKTALIVKSREKKF